MKNTKARATTKAALILSAAFFAPQFVACQEIPQATQSDEVITLEEFQVSSEKLRDTYIAGEVTAGTRTGDKIVLVPYSVQVFTEDFINDFQLFDNDSLLAYVSAATPNTGTSTGIRVRGFNALITRDGFQYAMPGSPSNTLQTEIIKGPLSTLYGRATPGGIVNKISRRPSTKPKYSASATLGSDYFRRFNATGTGPVPGTAGKLYYYAYAEYQNARPAHMNFQDGNKKYFLGLSLLYKFARATSLTVTIEYQPERTRDIDPGIILLPPTTGDKEIPADTPYVAGDPKKAVRGWRGIGDFSAYGPQVWRTCEYYGLNLLFEHRFNDVLSFRTAFQAYRKDSKKGRWSGGDQYRWSASGVYVGTNDRRPLYEHADERNGAGQMDLLARFNTGFVTHRILAAVDTSVFSRPLIQTLGTYSSALDGGIDKLSTNPDSPYYYPGRRLSFRPGFSLPVNDGGYGWYNNAFENIKTVNTEYKWEKFTAGALVSYRASLWQDTLAVMASGRFDYFDDLYDNKKTGTKGTLSDTAYTYSLGANYKIAGEALLIYASISTGFEPTSTVDDGIDKLVPPEKSFGYEAGFKGALASGKAGYTISLYTVELQNVRSNNPDYQAAGQGVPRYSTNNLNTAKGVDANFFVRPIHNFTLQGAVGCTDSKTDKADDQFAVGQPLQYVSKWNGSLVVRYEIPRWNVVTGVGLRVQTRFLCNYTTATVNDLWRPGIFLADAFINYKFKWGKTTHKIALNLSNITDKKYYTNAGRLNYGFEGRLSYYFNY